MSKEFLDCILFSYHGKFFVLPTIAIAEIAPPNRYQPMEITPFCPGTVVWRELILPLISLDLSPIFQVPLPPRIAIINALFSSNERFAPYFAILYEGRPSKLRIKENELAWTDQNQKKIKLAKEGEEEKEIFFPCLTHLSREIEKILTERKFTQITK